MRRRLVPIGACAAALVTLALVAPSNALAASCTPDAVTITDADNDGKYLHPPEIANVTASVDAACTLLMTDAIANRPSGLLSADRLYWWLDVDNNPATGRPNGPLAGVEFGLTLTNDGQGQLVDRFGQTITALPAAGPFAVAVAASMVGVAGTSTIRVIAYSQQAPPGAIFTDPPGLANNYFDYAQKPGDPPFVLSVRPAPGAPTPAPTPTAPAATPVGTATQCVVPRLRGLSVSAARGKLVAAHCALGAVRQRRASGKSGVVLGTSPVAGTTGAEGTKVTITVRARPR